MRLWLLFFCAASLVLSLRVAHAEPLPGPPELEARVRALGRIDALDPSVSRPLTLAREAIERARVAAARGDSAGHGRATELAQAALELAEARLALLRERALLRAAEARRAQAERERAIADQALERERARLRELQSASGER
jgi:hypothetical protein